MMYEMMVKANSTELLQGVFLQLWQAASFRSRYKVTTQASNKMLLNMCYDLLHTCSESHS